MKYIIIILIVIFIGYLFISLTKIIYEDNTHEFAVGDKWEIKNLSPQEKMYITIVAIDFDKKHIKYSREYWYNGSLCESSICGRDFGSFYSYLGISFASKIN